MQRLRPYIAVFSLLVFVFPLLQKAAHDLEHRDDFHCITKTQAHLHQTEHSCSFCDFNSTSLYTSFHAEKEFLSIPVSAFLFSFYSENFTVTPAFSFSMRGPPVA